MKILYKTMGLGLLSACLCLLCAAPASAKVCFVGEENCTGGGSFEDYENPDADGSLCKQEGYTEKSLCQADMTKYIVAYCPYNSNYVMCCGREYSYDACVYPLVADGKCGNRFKCRCDSDKYPYKQQSATICQNTVTGQNYNNSLASGASCVYTGFANGQTSINAYFTECLCDRGIYPKTEEECSTDGASVSEKACTDSNGNKYYTACICGDDYKVIASECEYGININEPMCQQADVLKAKKCCECNVNTYPYDDIEDVEASDSPVASYASCEKEKGCTRGSRYRAISCKKGYKVVSGKCVVKDCNELVDDYIADKKITAYAVYKSGSSPSAGNLIVAEDVNATWSKFKNKNVMSAAAYAQGLSGEDVLSRLMKQKCTSAPTISLSGTVYGPVYLTSVRISAYDITTSGSFNCTNCSIEASWMSNSGNPINLLYNNSMPNRENMYVNVSGSLTLTKNFSSVGYDFNVGTMGITNRYNGYKVIIRGKSAGERAVFKANTVWVKGFAMMRYVDATVKRTCLGIDCSYSVSSSVYFDESSDTSRRETSSSLNLYDTTYNIANGGELYMSTSTKIGQSTKEGGSMPETGRIRFANKTLSNLYMGSLHHKVGWGTAYGSIDQDGSYRAVEYTGYVWNFDGDDTTHIGGWMEIGGKSSRSKKQPRNFVCYVDYNGKPHKKYGSPRDSCKYHDDCQFGDNDNDNKRYYIRTDGHGYGG